MRPGSPPKGCQASSLMVAFRERPQISRQLTTIYRPLFFCLSRFLLGLFLFLSLFLFLLF